MRTRGDLPEMEGLQVAAGGCSEVDQMQQRGTLVIPACFNLKSVFNGSQITRRVPGISSLVKFARLSLAEELRSQVAWDYICHIRGWLSTRRFGYTSQNPREQSEDARSVQTEIPHWKKQVKFVVRCKMMMFAAADWTATLKIKEKKWLWSSLRSITLLIWR